VFVCGVGHCIFAVSMDAKQENKGLEQVGGSQCVL